MSRIVPLAVLGAFLMPGALRADAFDNYTNPLLARATTSQSVQRLKQVTPAQLAEYAGALPGTSAAMLIIRTNEGRLARLLVQAARQKVPGAGSVPIALVKRFVTFKEGEERTVQAEGQNVRLFDGFRLSLDIGQIVPEKVGGDLRFVSDPDRTVLEPVGKAELYLLTRPLAEASPKKGDKLVVGATFEPRYFTGTYKLYDDGRRSGTLQLKVLAKGDVAGWFYSDKDGRKYEVDGKVGVPSHSLRFRITYPRSVQDFQGWLFTGDGRALTGYSRFQTREAGFYALRVEEGKGER